MSPSDEESAIGTAKKREPNGVHAFLHTLELKRARSKKSHGGSQPLRPLLRRGCSHSLVQGKKAAKKRKLVRLYSDNVQFLQYQNGIENGYANEKSCQIITADESDVFDIEIEESTFQRGNKHVFWTPTHCNVNNVKEIRHAAETSV